MNPLKLLQAVLKKPVDFALHASPQQRIDAFNSNLQTIASDPVHRLGFGGDMAYTTGVDTLTSKPMSGPPLARSGINKLVPTAPVADKINIGGGASMPAQSDVAAAAYENALNQSNVPLLNQIMKLHPGDARFAVHLNIPGLH